MYYSIVSLYMYSATPSLCNFRKMLLRHQVLKGRAQLKHWRQISLMNSSFQPRKMFYTLRMATTETRAINCSKSWGFSGFLFGLGAAVVVLMLMLGIMFVPGCDECKKEIVPSQSSAAQSVGSEQELWRVIKEERLKHFPSRKTINLISAAWSDRGARLETLGLLALQERMV